MTDRDAVTPLDAEALRGWPLPQLGVDADKERRGRVLVIAGSRETPGAALLAAQSVLRAGAGKVQVGTVQAVALPLALQLPEARVIGLPESRDGGLEAEPAAETLAAALRVPDVVLIGPGLRDEASAVTLAKLLRRAFPDTPLVLDAVAMTAVLRWSGGTSPVLLTPHAGEMVQLLALRRPGTLEDLQATVQQCAAEWRVTVALKGATTWLACPDGRGWRHDGDSPGLGTAGSGDVLAGLIAGFAGRGAPLEQAAAWGIVVHAVAGRRLERRLGRLGFLARELADEVPAVIDALDRP